MVSSQLIEETLDALLKTRPSPFKHLYEGARYLVFAPSKRIRPLIVLTVVDMLQGDIKKALYPASALELLHTYSLIHDDLPCMDDDEIRRGQPSLHKVYDEATALLIGDFLLTYAFEVIATSPNLTPAQIVALTRILAKQGGGEGMIGGQLMDIENHLSKKEINQRKTGALFVASFQFGGIIANASEETFHKLTLLGEKVGLLFQLVDDLVDEECEDVALSKKEALLLADEAKELFSFPPLHHLIQKIVDRIPNLVLSL